MRLDTPSLLTAMETRHHGTARVALLMVDEMDAFTVTAADHARLNAEAQVARTAAYIGIPIWIAELGPNRKRTLPPLMQAAGGGAVTPTYFGKPRTDCFDRTDLRQQLQAAGIDTLVVTGRMGNNCVSDTILGNGSEGAVKDFTVFTSPDVILGPLQTEAADHPKCLVFASVGTELWPLGPLPWP